VAFAIKADEEAKRRKALQKVMRQAFAGRRLGDDKRD
jgi:hypothetical protein